MPQLTKRQKEIVQVSIKLIERGGIQELTIKNISSEMNITEPAIYRHFKCKQDIILSILQLFENMSQKGIKELKELEESGIPALESIKIFFKNRFKKLAEKRALASVIFSEEMFRYDQRLSDKVFEIMKINQKALVWVLKNGQIKGQIRNDLPAEHFVFIIMGAFRLLVTRWRMSGFYFDLNEEGEKLSRSLVEIMKPINKNVK